MPTNEQEQARKGAQIMTRLFFLGLILGLWCEIAAAQAPQLTQPPQQPGTATQIGEKIDRGLTQIGTELSQAWAEARKSIEKMGVQGRVYGRLHWDKALDGAKLEISVRDNQVVVLSGHVATAAAKQKAEQIANDTIGVNSVVNELSVTSSK